MSYQLIKNLEEASSTYDVLLCDLWGCFHNGIRPYPQAVSALEKFRESGGVVVFITNAPRPSPGIKAQLAAMGVPDDLYQDVVSSGDAAQAALQATTYGEACFHLGPDRDNPMFADAAVARVPDFRTADFIFCTGLFHDEVETPEDYRDLVESGVSRNLTFLCANPDIVADRGPKRIYCAGSIAQKYSAAGGTVVYFGKPHKPVYDLALEKVRRHAECDLSRVLAVGDGIHTDVKGAIDYGIDVVFITSGIAQGDTQDTAQLDSFLEQHGCQPNYVMSALC